MLSRPGAKEIACRAPIDQTVAANEEAMQITVRVSNAGPVHSLEIDTDGRRQSIAIPSKNTGLGSNVNGGMSATGFEYTATPRPAIDELVRAMDAIAEIHNTLRSGCAVRLIQLENP
jgi:hypothetical protein